jgi:hypothetical protein
MSDTTIVRRFFSGLIIVVGALMAGLAGLCSMAFLGMPGGGGDKGLVPLVLVFGGPPIVIGAALVWFGVWLWRKG